ncbi:MAG: peptidase M23 [Alphaproteobacteria bacterium]|nr:MAG: peptidase M23 [Alphaproteobacteria bacterium]
MRATPWVAGRDRTCLIEPAARDLGSRQASRAAEFVKSLPSNTGKPGRMVQNEIPGGSRTVLQIPSAVTRLTQSVARVLPSHEFTWHRANGHDLTIEMGTRTQVMAIASAITVAGWLGIATSAMVSSNGDAALAAKQVELARMQNQLQAMKSETAALKGDVAARAEALEARQKFLAALLTGKRDMAKLAGMLPRQVADADRFATVNDLVAPTIRGKRGKAVAAPIVQTASLTEPFRALESQQLAFVDKATGAAEAKLRDTQALIRRLGLDPSRFVQSSDWNGNAQGAMGGPYIPVSADAEPRFKDLFLSWKKLSVLQAAVGSIPAYMPVKDYRYTSGFGVRFDPFNGGSAMHAGLDMAGAMGEPIYASANGTVLQAGRSGGYGNLVELSHGKGIDTRYGHLSKILVRPGEHVRQGQIIGRMGSTGRSTGTHLHYEVRIDGRAVNARPFLDASAFVLAAQGEAGAVMQASAPADFGPLLDDDRVVASASTARMTPIRSLR